MKNMLEKIQSLYWSIIPHEYRPHHIWYTIKCFCWYRYSTVKPRYCSHQWIDRCDLLPEIAFEILSDFLEKECQPEEHIDWYYEDEYWKDQNKILVNDKLINVRDEMQFLYDWWHTTYHKIYPEVKEILHKELKKYRDKDHMIKDILWNPYASKEDEEAENTIIHAITNLDNKVEEELQNNLHRLINIRKWLWT